MDRFGSEEPWARIAYGIDAQSTGTVVVRAERGRGGVTYSTLPPGPLPGDALLVVALGPRESVSQWLDVPTAAGRRARRILPTLLDIRMPFPIEDCEYAFIMPTSRKAPLRALALAARTRDVAAKLAALAAQGVDPAVFDHEGVALWSQSLQEDPMPESGREFARVVAHVDGDRTTLAIGTGAEFRAAHALRSADLSQARRLVPAALGGAAGQVDWRWSGPSAADRDRVAILSESVGGLIESQPTVHRDPAAFLARALARRAVAPDGWPCNLRVGDVEHALVTRRRSRAWMRTLALTLAAAVALVAADFGALSAVATRRATLDGEYQARTAQLAGAAVGGAKGEEALLIVTRHVDARRTKLKPYRDAFSFSLTECMASILQAADVEGSAVESLDMTADKIVVTGRCQDDVAAREIADALKAAGFTPGVELGEALADGARTFVVRGERPDA